MKTRTSWKSTTDNAATRFNSRNIIRHAFVASALTMGILATAPNAKSQWSLTGNAGTTPGTDFVGTTDANALVFKTNSTEAMRITTGQALAIGTTTANATRLQVLDNGGGDPAQIENNNTSTTLNFQAALSLLNLETSTLAQTELSFGHMQSGVGGSAFCIATIDAVPTSIAQTGYKGDLVFGVTDGTATNNSTERMRIKSNGEVGIGISSPAYTLDVDNSSSAGTIHSTGDMYAPAFVGTSDERLKENISTIPGALQQIMRLRGVEFDWRTGVPGAPASKDHQIGVIAQEVQKVVPEAVVMRPDGYYGVNYSELIPILIEGVKDQQGEIAQRDSALQNANATISDLDSRVSKLEAEISLLLPNATAGVTENSNPSISFFQNNPNPFNTSTTISYSIPSSVSKAELIITSSNGVEVTRIPLQKGSSQVEINASNLASGQYFYTVVADGNMMPAKTMSVIK